MTMTMTVVGGGGDDGVGGRPFSVFVEVPDLDGAVSGLGGEAAAVVVEGEECM